MLKLAFDGITAFSYKPLKIATSLGSIAAISGFIYLLVLLLEKLFTSITISGWAVAIAAMLFLSGLILVMLGIIGEYIGRIYDEAKGRPIYIIGEKEGFECTKI
jgi:glycosyltransferase involved in cell wall biosynthesis